MHYKKVATETEYYIMSSLFNKLKKVLFNNLFSNASRGPLSFASLRGNVVVESDRKQSKANDYTFFISSFLISESRPFFRSFGG